MGNTNKQPAFGLPFPGLGAPLKPANLNAQLTKLNLRPNAQQMPSKPTPPLRAPEAKTSTEKKGQGKKKKQKKGQKSTGADDNYTPYGLMDDSTPSDSSDSFRGSESERVLGIVPNKRGKPITFSYPGEIPLATMQLEDNLTPDYVTSLSTATFQSTMKLTWNLANYSTAFTRLSTSSEVSGHLDIIYERYSRMVIAKIRSGIISSWTLADFKSYLRNVCILLETYYSTDSILAYEGSINEPDRNPTLIRMKQQYSDFAIQVVHDKARSILKNTWFPERFSQLIRWTYQNYKTGPAYQCSNYRYFPDAICVQSGASAFDASKFVAYYEQCIANVTTVTNRNITSLLSNTMPDGMIGTLPDSCNMAVYDRQHHESYINQGISWYTGTQVDGWPTTTNNGYILYSSSVNANEAGAFPFVLSTTYDTTIKEFKNGLLHPIAAVNTQAGVAFAWNYRTNKFFAYNTTQGSDSFEAKPRNLNSFSQFSSEGDIHRQNVDSAAASYAAAIGKACMSMSKHGQQTLYFNTSESRTLILREFMNWLFYLA